MKTVISILAAVAAVLSALAGLDLAGVIDILPPAVAPWVAVGPPIAAAALHFVVALGDLLDDGKKNGSFKFGRFGPVVAFLLVICFCLASTSCTGVWAGVTGQTVPSVSVQRAGHDGAPVVQVAAADFAQAELDDPATVYGLYDVGRLSAAVAGMVEQAK